MVHLQGLKTTIESTLVRSRVTVYTLLDADVYSGDVSVRLQSPPCPGRCMLAPPHLRTGAGHGMSGLTRSPTLIDQPHAGRHAWPPLAHRFICRDFLSACAVTGCPLDWGAAWKVRVSEGSVISTALSLQ